MRGGCGTLAVDQENFCALNELRVLYSRKIFDYFGRYDSPRKRIIYGFKAG
jgi:hypothetical protein